MFLMFENRWLIVVLMCAITLKYHGAHASRGLKPRLILNSIECPTYDKQIVDEFNCTLVKAKDGTNRLNVNFEFKQEVRNITGLIKVIFNRQTVNETYYTVELPACQALGQIQKNFVLKIITTELHRTSNLPLDCPLKKSFPYYIREFSLDAGAVPNFLPDLTWYWLATFKVDNKKVQGFNACGSIKRVASAQRLKSN